MGVVDDAVLFYICIKAGDPCRKESTEMR